MFTTRKWLLIPIILATRRLRSGGAKFKARLGKKFEKPYLNRRSWAWWHTSTISAT
jgi:hypothetical protein